MPIYCYNEFMSQIHDSSYKFLFSNPELVRDLVMGFIPDDWLHTLDYSTLEKVSCSYVIIGDRPRLTRKADSR